MNRMRFALVFLLGSAWLGAAGPRALAAQPAPLGPEVLLLTHSFPNRPVLAVQPGGDSVVAFDDDSSSRASIFYRHIAAGSMPPFEWPLSIESPEADPVTDAVTATPQGFDVIWHVLSSGKVTAFYRGHLNLHGEPEGQPVRVGGTGTDWTWQVRGNGFMAGWALPKVHGIAARRLSSSGQRTGPELRLNSRPVDAPTPVVLPIANGGFMAVWLGTAPGSTATQVLRSRRFSPVGKPLGPDFDVNTVPLNVAELDPRDPAAFLVAAAPGGGFAVAWMSDANIYLRFFDAAGKALAPEVPAVTDEFTEALASMAFDNAGNLLLLWRLFGQEYEDLQIQIFDPHGAPLGPPELVRSEASDIYKIAWQGSVAWAGDSWLVAWVAAGVPQGDFATIVVRRFAGH